MPCVQTLVLPKKKKKEMNTDKVKPIAVLLATYMSIKIIKVWG
jgi:hypothetical protein